MRKGLTPRMQLQRASKIIRMAPSFVPAITALVSNGKTLEEAYNEAVWSVPAYREAQLKAQPKAPTAEEKAAKVRKAKKAADTTKMSSKTSAKSKEAELSLADELRATWNELAS